MRNQLALGVAVLAIGSMGFGPSVPTRADTGWQFAPAATYAAGTQPVAIAVADFDRDGNLDLAVANEGSGDVSILRGVGDGTFLAATSVAGGGAISALWAGDATLDGKPDLIVMRVGSTAAEFHAGNGDLTFAAPFFDGYVDSGPATAIAVFDWTHERPPHFAFAVGGQNVNVAVRQADGTFGGGGIGTSYFTQTRCLAGGDVTGDGWGDLVVGGAGGTVVYQWQGPQGGVWPVQIDTALDVRGVAIADFDRDGRPDVVSVGSPAPTVAVHRNAGLRDFRLAQRATVGADGRDVRVADFDGDGIPDLLVVHASGWALLRGAGDCTFGAAQLSGSGTDVRGGVVADFDRDGRPDVAIVRRGTNDVEVRLNRIPWKKGGTFENETPLQLGASPFEPVVGDIDRDGRPDVVALANGADTMSTFLGTETGFQTGVPYPTASQPRALALADFDHDGRLDAVCGSMTGTGVDVRLGNDTGFGDATFYPSGTWPYDAEVADVNRDGHLDIVVSHSYYIGPGVVSTLLGRGDGTFGDPIVSYAGTNPCNCVLADFDRDGILDVAVTNTNLGQASTVSVLLGVGDGSFGPATDFPVGAGPQQVAAADFDRDGALDLVVANANSASISCLRGHGDGTFEAAVDVPIPNPSSRPAGVLAIDVDRDGKPDLVVSDVNLYAVWTLRGLGDGTFATAVATDTDAAMTFAVSADFLDRDGLPDLAATTYTEGTVRILKNVSPPAPDIASDATDFGTFVLGDTVTASRAVSVRNVGDLSLHVTDAAIVGGDPGAFTAAWPTGNSIDVAPGTSAEIVVKCTATDAGPCAGVLRITSNDPDQPTLDVSLAANPVRFLVLPATGAIGSTFTYRGPLGAKGSAALKFGKKSIALKTVSWTAGAPGTSVFVFQPKSAKPGVYDLVLKPKKQQTATWAGVFAVAPPEALTLSPPSGVAKTDVTIAMNFPGARRGSVSLYDPAKRRKTACKVVAWTPTVADGGATGVVRFLVPAKLVKGKVYDVRIANGVGTATLPAAFTAQ